MNSLVAAHWQQRPKAPQFAKAEVENHYYQSHEPRHRRFLPLVPLAAFVGVLALVLDIAIR